jgi:hypothetical protein
MMLANSFHVTCERCLLLLLLPFAVTSCSVTFPQVDALQSQFSSGGKGSLTVPRDALWLASFEGQGHILAAYQREGFILFANADTEAEVTFDGWTVLSVKGFGDQTPSEFTINASEGGSRSYTAGSRSAKDDCSAWIWQPAIELGGVWQQQCDESGPNTISLNAAGAIVAIEQQVGPEGQRLILQRYQRD